MSEFKKYVHYFETESDYNDARENDYHEPWVSYTESNKRVNYNKSEKEDWPYGLLDTPLTFEITYGGKLWFYAELGSDPKTIEYKKNNDDWVSITAKTPDAYGMVEPFTTVVAGDVVQFRGNNSIPTNWTVQDAS